jgi:hypothetical protein
MEEVGFGDMRTPAQPFAARLLEYGECCTNLHLCQGAIRLCHAGACRAVHADNCQVWKVEVRSDCTRVNECMVMEVGNGLLVST